MMMDGWTMDENDEKKSKQVGECCAFMSRPDLT